MRGTILLIAAALAAGGCRDADGPSGPGSGGGRVYVTSEPSGARIFIDERDSGRLTPDTVGGLTGLHTVHVQLDSMGIRYEYSARIALVRRDSVPELHGVLAVQCAFANDMSGCYRRMHSYHTAAGTRFATSPIGSLFLFDGQGQGVFWPANSGNSYVSSAIPVMGAMVGSVPVSLGAYDHAYLAGRPAPSVGTAAGRFTLQQTTWIVPPTSAHMRVLTMRGVEVRQDLQAVDSVPGVIIVKLTFHNISATPEYQTADPLVPAAGVTYEDAYIGLILDPDIGESRDDWLSYDRDLSMAFAYDARFAEPLYAGGANAAPGLVGLRALRVPDGTVVMLNGWLNQAGLSDWIAGTVTEGQGYGMLSGWSVYPPAHADPRIGHLPQTEGDVRLSVTAGPLRLAPGEEAEIVLAIAFAGPAAGTFQTGVQLHPGDPLDANRALYRVAQPLRDRMAAAALLAGQ